MSDYLFRGSLADLDPEVYELTQIEAERQARKLILIPSESQAPLAVREAMSSAFQNIYAEGYPDEDMPLDERGRDPRLSRAAWRTSAATRTRATTRASNTPTLVEALARRRCAEAFAANGVSADQIYVNVQALSGAPANNAVYQALVEPGSVVMGMNLLHGGHLTHGSSANRSGKLYKIVHYTVDPETEQIDYDAVMELAQENKPKMIICGYSSYSWIPDWKTFRRIADSGRRLPAGRYLAHRRADRRRRGAFADRLCPRHHLHHPQDPGRPARRGHPDHRPGPGQKARQGRLPRRTGRAARPHLCRPGAHLQTGPAPSSSRNSRSRPSRTPRPCPNASRNAACASPLAAPTPTCSTWTAAPSKARTAPPSPATRPPASWTWPASSSTATPSPATNPPSTRPASAWARPGSPSAASTRRNPASWPTSWPMCCWPARRTASIPPQGQAAAPRQGGFQDA